MSFLVVCKILRHFTNTLTANHKYSFRNSEISSQPFQMELSQKQNTFSEI